MSKVKIQYVSDLHLEFPVNAMKLQDLPKKGEILVLGGDIGIPNGRNDHYEKFLLKMGKKFKHVLVIAGNHEFYHDEYDNCKKTIRKITKKTKNVHFLDKESIVIEGIRFIGATLWSLVPKENKLSVLMMLNDYRLIKLGKKPLDVDDTVKMFDEELQFIKDEIKIAKEKKEKIVVCTHHAPLTKGTSNPQYEKPSNKCNCAFSSDLKYLLDKDYPSTWIFGHTHWNSKQTINGWKILSNQCGYIQYGESKTFNPEETVEV